MNDSPTPSAGDALATYYESPAGRGDIDQATARPTTDAEQQVHESVLGMLAAALPVDTANDSPVEAFTRQELAKIGRPVGRPSLSGRGESRPRHFRIPRALDDRLAETAARTHKSRSDIVREALEEYLPHATA